MLLLLAVTALLRVAAGADGTSSITCTMATNGGIVNVRSTWGALCKAAAFDQGIAKAVEFSVFGLDVSGFNGNIINVNPPSGERSIFDFQVSVKDTTGMFQITNVLGVAPIPIIVVDVPTNMSTMVCDSILNVSTQVKCTLTPRDISGSQIWSEAKIYSMAGVDIGTPRGGRISWQPLSPTVGSSFEVLGTFPYSGVFGVNNGVPGPLANVAAVDQPDGTTTMTCVPAVVAVTDSPRCNIVARRGGVPIVTSYTAFSLSGVNKGTIFGRVRPEGSMFIDLGTSFGFDLIVGDKAIEPFANTGVFPLSNGVSAQDFMMTVVADPDTTSSLTCESQQVVAGGSIECSSLPKLQGIPIWSLTSIWVLSVEDKLGQQGSLLGSFSSITPVTAGSFFNWSLTANAIISNQTFPFDITLNDGRSPIFVIKMVAPELPDESSNMTCTPLSLAVGETTVCTIFANKMGMPVVAAKNAFSLTDAANGGQFSPITPLAGKIFSFSYMPTSQGTIALSNGRTVDPVTLTVSPAIPTNMPTPFPTTSPSTQPPSVSLAPTAADTPTAVTITPTTAVSPTAAPTEAVAPSSPTAPTSPTVQAPSAAQTPTAKAPSAVTPTSAQVPSAPTSPTAPTVKAPSNPPTNTAQVTTGGEEGGLGAGGIVVIVLAVLLLGAGGWLLYRRQRKHHKVNQFDRVEHDEMMTYEPPRI
jgi:hypothetical protein